MRKSDFYSNGLLVHVEYRFWLEVVRYMGPIHLMQRGMKTMKQRRICKPTSKADAPYQATNLDELGCLSGSSQWDLSIEELRVTRGRPSKSEQAATNKSHRGLTSMCSASLKPRQGLAGQVKRTP